MTSTPEPNVSLDPLQRAPGDPHPPDGVQTAAEPAGPVGRSGERPGRHHLDATLTVLISVGVFCLSLALLLPLFVYSRLALQPADPQILQIQTTNDGSALIPDLSLPTGVPITHTGLVTFPFNSKKQDYMVWDINLNRSRMAVYSGTARRNGMPVYKYTATNDWSPVDSRDLPGALFGLKTPSVRAEGQYADRRTYFVEPTTGSTLGVEEHLHQRYLYEDRTVTAVSALFQSPSLLAERVDQIRQGRDRAPLDSRAPVDRPRRPGLLALLRRGSEVRAPVPGRSGEAGSFSPEAISGPVSPIAAA